MMCPGCRVLIKMCSGEVPRDSSHKSDNSPHRGEQLGQHLYRRLKDVVECGGFDGFVKKGVARSKHAENELNEAWWAMPFSEDDRILLPGDGGQVGRIVTLLSRQPTASTSYDTAD